MESRPVIDMARGVVMATCGCSAEDGWTCNSAVHMRLRGRPLRISRPYLRGGRWGACRGAPPRRSHHRPAVRSGIAISV
ncbi:ANTAR domain-containing protein [Streptomyces sp. NPDC002787]